MGRQFNKQTSDDGDFIVAPEGTSAAVLTVLAYLGKHESTWQGETRMRDLVGLSWELAERADDGRAIAVTEVVTNSLHEKSKLFSRVLALTGGREPPPGFDLEKLLGRGAIVTVVHDLRDGKTWANVGQVGPLPRGMPAPATSVAPVYYDIEDHDRAAFEKMPARFRKLAETGEVSKAAMPRIESPQAKMESRLAQQQRPAPLPTDAAPFDDDIPF
jgi:hypothetical protein